MPEAENAVNGFLPPQGYQGCARLLRGHRARLLKPTTRGVYVCPQTRGPMKALRHPRQWLSVALLAGLLVMAIAGALFVYLADEVGEQARLTRLDSKVPQFFHRLGVPWSVHEFESVTFFGNASTLAVLGFALARVLCALRR